jgi:hypothetical protein
MWLLTGSRGVCQMPYGFGLVIGGVVESVLGRVEDGGQGLQACAGIACTACPAGLPGQPGRRVLRPLTVVRPGGTMTA